jgi:putative endonuclease
MPYMYILKCTDGSFYTGSTWDLKRRLGEHQQGLGSRHTSRRLPVELVYYEAFVTIADAFAREKQVQGWSHAKKDALIRRSDALLHELSECRNETHCR